MSRPHHAAARLAAFFVTLASCGGGKSATSTTVADPKEAVRAQALATIDSYVQSISTQIPDVTSKVGTADIASCVQQRVNQMIDTAELVPGQPEAQFASTLMNQVQSSLYGLVGMCTTMTK